MINYFIQFSQNMKYSDLVKRKLNTPVLQNKRFITATTKVSDKNTNILDDESINLKIEKTNKDNLNVYH